LKLAFNNLKTKINQILLFFRKYISTGFEKCKECLSKRRILRPVWFIPGTLFLVLLILILFVWCSLPDIDRLKQQNPEETAMMRYQAEKFVAKGQPVKKRHRWVRLSRISPYLIHAVLIAEDDKFYQHQGFDWESINLALEKNLDQKRIVRGGSTITQQVAKNLYLEPTRNPIRKIREALIAYQLERKLTKKRILEIYLNIIEWGRGIYGAEAAAKYYYGKSARQLNYAESIRLASILPNPRRFSPVSNKSRRMNYKRRLIASRMLRRGIISQPDYDAFLADLQN